MKFSALIASALAAVSTGHLCALSPLQRGGAAGANETGADVCFQTKGPCPPTPQGSPASAFVAGSTTYVSLMKNMDHHNPAAPGNFSAYLWDASGNSVLVGAFPDTPAPSLTVYPVAVTVPAGTPAGNYVLQTIYFTDNTAAPPAFYQCSDVQVL